MPLIFRWLGKIRSGKTSQRLVANYDILATIAEITGFSKPLHTDGISFYDELTSKNRQVNHEFVVYASYTGPTLITTEGWKIRTDLTKEVFELFFLPDDFKEEHDLSKQYPQKLNLLKEKLLKACDGDFYNGLYSDKNSITKVPFDTNK